jgi:hypothetical protein
MTALKIPSVKHSIMIGLIALFIGGLTGNIKDEYLKNIMTILKISVPVFGIIMLDFLLG